MIWFRLWLVSSFLHYVQSGRFFVWHLHDRSNLLFGRITHPTETQPVLDPLVTEKREPFSDPLGFLSETKMKQELWENFGLSVVGPKGLKYFRKRFPLRNFKRHKSKRMQRDSVWRIRAYENNWPMNNEPWVRTRLVIGKPCKTDKLVFSVWTCF